MVGEDKALNGAAKGASAGSVGGPWGMAIGAGLGGLLGIAAAEEEQKNARKQAMIAASRDEFSPWTELKGTNPGQVNKLGITAAGLMSGAAAGQKYGGSLGGGGTETPGDPSKPVDAALMRERVTPDIAPTVNLFESSDAGLRNRTQKTPSYDQYGASRLRPGQSEGLIYAPDGDGTIKDPLEGLTPNMLKAALGGF
jgi:hypothetical protein